MAYGANTIFDVRTGGSDTANGGCFDPGQTAGMFTDGVATLANTSAPVFTSASYNFVAGDVNHWLYIASGTNWTPGWYQIASVAANAATLTAGLGAYYLSINKSPTRVSTNAGLFADAVGCATIASPTGATWTIDYSQSTTARVSYTDLASAGAGLTVSSAANPFGKQMVGNGLIIASGTNFTAGVYVVASVAATVATVVGAANMTTGVGVSGVGGLGGCFATPGKAAGLKVAGNDIFWQSGTYNLSGNTVNTAGCQVSDTIGGVDQTNLTWWVGWNTTRTLHNADTSWPTINANLQTALTLFSMTGVYTRARNIIVDGNSKASLTGFNQNASYQKIDHIKAQNCTVVGIDLQGGNAVEGDNLSGTGCSGTAGVRVNALASVVEVWANTTTGIVLSNNAILKKFLSYANTGASSFGVGFNSVGASLFDGVCYGNGADGVDTSNSIGSITCENVICEANGAAGWKTGAVRDLVRLINCASYNNTSGHFTPGNITDLTGFVIGTGSFFVDAPNGNFAINNNGGAGAALRALGSPGLFPRGTSTGYTDIGAAQHRDPPLPGSLVMTPTSSY